MKKIILLAILLVSIITVSALTADLEGDVRAERLFPGYPDTDAYLYRSAADYIRTPDSLRADTLLYGGTVQAQSYSGSGYQKQALTGNLYVNVANGQTQTYTQWLAGQLTIQSNFAGTSTYMDGISLRINTDKSAPGTINTLYGIRVDEYVSGTPDNINLQNAYGINVDLNKTFKLASGARYGIKVVTGNSSIYGLHTDGQAYTGGNASFGKNISIKGNITLYSPNGNPWNCGVDNSGNWRCS